MNSNSVRKTADFLPALFLLLVCVLGAAAQPASKTLTEKTFSFDYPADWRLLDKSSPGVQQYNLMPPTGNVLIMLISFDTLVPGYDDFTRARENTAQKLADRLYVRLNQTGNAKLEDVCTELRYFTLPGRKITGFYDNNPSTAEIYYFALNEKFFNLIYLRDDKDSAQTDAAWKMLLKSFSFKKFNEKKPDYTIDIGSEVVLNGRAKKLAVPLYPREALPSFGRVPDVKVRIVIDESGKVIKAKASNVTGTMASYAENAALDSKFEPSIVCGKPSRSNGIIIYLGFDQR
jgi:hypothetical protein